MRKQLNWDGVQRLAKFKKRIISFSVTEDTVNKRFVASWQEFLLIGAGDVIHLKFICGKERFLSCQSLQYTPEQTKDLVMELAISEYDFVMQFYPDMPNIVAELQFEATKQKLKDARAEQSIETVLAKGVKKLGGLCFKVSSENHRGLPDRLIVLDGFSYYVETKKLTGELSEAQTVRHSQFRENGVIVNTLRGINDVNEYLDCLTKKASNNTFVYETNNIRRRAS